MEMTLLRFMTFGWPFTGAVLRTILEIGFGLVYLVGALFNSLYTVGHGQEFYGSFARGAWLTPARGWIQRLIIPRSKAFTLALIGFQLLVALAILTRGPLVVVGLLAGAAFSFLAVFASNVPGALTNLLMALTQLYLANTH